MLAEISSISYLLAKYQHVPGFIDVFLIIVDKRANFACFSKLVPVAIDPQESPPMHLVKSKCGGVKQFGHHFLVELEIRV